jgi:hypothetical protein
MPFEQAAAEPIFFWGMEVEETSVRRYTQAAGAAYVVVVDVRLKGSGMHWARANVNPLVALRTVACANRWAEV